VQPPGGGVPLVPLLLGAPLVPLLLGAPLELVVPSQAATQLCCSHVITFCRFVFAFGWALTHPVMHVLSPDAQAPAQLKTATHSESLPHARVDVQHEAFRHAVHESSAAFLLQLVGTVTPPPPVVPPEPLPPPKIPPSPPPLPPSLVPVPVLELLHATASAAARKETTIASPVLVELW
jgi:hypothetical protein